MIVQIRKRLRKLYTWLDERSGHFPSLLRDTVESFGKARGAEAAAGMAYYTFFSLFPLLLAVIAAGSYFLEREQVYQQVVSLIHETFPLAQDLIERNIQRVLELRGAVGLIGLVGALWSASGVFTILSRNINRAWPKAEPRSFFQRRLVALAMIAALSIPLALSFLASTFLTLLAQWQIPLLGGVAIYETTLWKLLSNLVPWLVALLLFLALYRWIPKTTVDWINAVWGALFAALAWQGGTYVFSWYLSSGLARYEWVYGSLGALAALLFWIYVSSWILLFGAHLSAAVGRHRRKGQEKSPTKQQSCIQDTFMPLQRWLQEQHGYTHVEATQVIVEFLTDLE
jgi:membrane protein